MACIAAVVLGLVASPASARQTSLTFLVTGINAEAAGIGDAGIGATQASFAAFWNPAAVASNKFVSDRAAYDGSTRSRANNELGVAHHVWVGPTRTYGAGGRFGVGRNGGVGLHAIATDSGGTSEEGDATYFTASIAYGLSLGRLDVGVATKLVTQSVNAIASHGFALDAGFMSELFRRGVRVGASIVNVGRMSEARTIPTELPTTVRAGVALYPFRIVAIDDGFPLLDLLLAVEVSHDLENDATRLHIGASGVLLDTIVARAGYITNDPLRGPTLGLGLHYNALNFDYAAIPFAQGFGGIGHVMTLAYGF